MICNIVKLFFNCHYLIIKSNSVTQLCSLCRFKLLMRTLHEFGSRMANSKFPTSQSWPPLLLHLRMKGGGI
ncbi:hypothetical protein BDA96_03G233700 [Sorghum bicolor]|uniref:Uncharacterized protein n=1 Tax=Sorghum bicolor TaxID=4558 RepID=A0A921RDJ7_SORBI|nr:hypothetical protein BDA96_03G233700 [Sorghum bicolor]